MAALQTPATATNSGFLTILREGAGYLGGYLVTNLWGRPLEFRLSSAVQPNRVQQILYGQSLEPYICGDLIGKALVDKTATAAQVIFTDQAAALDLRLRFELPVALVHPSAAVSPTTHPHFPSDAAVVRAFCDRMGNFDFAEPFSRIREAIAEARKLGIGGRN
jgi:hypothetical protein